MLTNNYEVNYHVTTIPINRTLREPVVNPQRPSCSPLRGNHCRGVCHTLLLLSLLSPLSLLDLAPCHCLE